MGGPSSTPIPPPLPARLRFSSSHTLAVILVGISINRALSSLIILMSNLTDSSTGSTRWLAVLRFGRPLSHARSCPAFLKVSQAIRDSAQKSIPAATPSACFCWRRSMIATRKPHPVVAQPLLVKLPTHPHTKRVQTPVCSSAREHTLTHTHTQTDIHLWDHPNIPTTAARHRVLCASLRSPTAQGGTSRA